jgi:hypothetical protein
MADEKSPQTAGPSGSRTGIRVVLIVILVLLIIALLHDRFRARPQWEAAYEAIAQRNTEVNASPDDLPMDAAAVKSIVGFAPSSSAPHPGDDRFMVETYTWRRGLPWMTYKLLAVYSEGGKRFLYHCKTTLPEEKATPKPPEDDQRDTEAAHDEGDAGARPQPQRRAPLDFAALDADGDGKLTAEELGEMPEERRARFLESADADGDGAISKEEFDNRPRRGGRGGAKDQPAEGGAKDQPAEGGAKEPQEPAKPADQGSTTP